MNRISCVQSIPALISFKDSNHFRATDFSAVNPTFYIFSPCNLPYFIIFFTPEPSSSAQPTFLKRREITSEWIAPSEGTRRGSCLSVQVFNCSDLPGLINYFFNYTSVNVPLIFQRLL